MFIKKFNTKKYDIGSFDVNLEKTINFIMEKDNITKEEVEEKLKKLPTTYRASIQDKEGNYVGYISVYDIDGKNQSGKIIIQVKDIVSLEDKKEILNIYKKWIIDSLNITNNKSITTNIIIAPKYLKEGIDSDVLTRYKESYNVPNLIFPYTIQDNGKVIGIIGLSNLIWSNQRANLQLFLDKNIDQSIINELISKVIDDYIGIVHSNNVHNITYSVGASDNEMLKALNNSQMNYYANIPFAHSKDDMVESNLMYQHTPGMQKKENIIQKNNIILPISTFNTDKKELSNFIDLGNGFHLINPKFLSEQDFNKIKKEFAKSMEERQNFTIPLGEDKYIAQLGNGNYGLSKAIFNYNYVLINDNTKEYCGYINILRTNANNKNAEIEIGIKPTLQNKGLGTQVINKFYNELFEVGFASITSAVFDFNTPSLKLHNKVANLNGIRLESYYINGKLWDIHYYTKVNPITEDKKIR